MEEQDDFTRPWWLLPVGRVNPWWWTAVAASFLAFDYFGGGGTEFPTLYLIPVRGSDTEWYKNVRKRSAIQLSARGNTLTANARLITARSVGAI